MIYKYNIIETHEGINKVIRSIYVEKHGRMKPIRQFVHEVEMEPDFIIEVDKFEFKNLKKLDYFSTYLFLNDKNCCLVFTISKNDYWKIEKLLERNACHKLFDEDDNKAYRIMKELE